MTKHFTYRETMWQIIDALPDSNLFIRVERDVIQLGYGKKVTTIHKDEQLTQAGIEATLRLLQEVRSND